MSAFHPIATEQRTQFYVGSVPITEVAVLDHFVGAHIGGPVGCFGSIRLAAGSNRERTGGSRMKGCCLVGVRF